MYALYMFFYLAYLFVHTFIYVLFFYFFRKLTYNDRCILQYMYIRWLCPGIF